MKSKRRTNLILGILLSVPPQFAGDDALASSQKKTFYTFGVFPFVPPTRLDRMFGPVIVDLAKVLGQEVRFRTTSSYRKFSSEIARQTFDIAFVQPFDYVPAHDRFGYMPVARRKGTLQSIVVVDPSSPDMRIKDLRGKILALPPPPAAVSFLTRELLLDLGLLPDKDVKIVHLASHFACMQSVLARSAAACGTGRFPIRIYERVKAVQFRAIAKSKPIAQPLFIVHRRIPRETRDVIRARILSWGNTDDSMNVLHALGGPSPFVEANDREYDRVRQTMNKLKE